ncbi:MAG: TetR/AcrR family transcriptional regulator [Candidatus Dormibacteria bacterium]
MEVDTAVAVATSRRRGSDDAGSRRAQIIRAATSVLARQGYNDTSLKEIAREAGVAPGLLHYYFESKEELLLDVVHLLDRELTQTWQRAVANIEDPLERITAALDAAEARCSQQPEFWRLMFDLYMLGLSNPAIHRRCQELWSRFVDDIEAEVRQVLGRLPAYAIVPPRELAGTVAAAIDGISLAALIEAKSPAPHFRALKMLLLSLVVTAYVTSGQEPPIERLRELVARSPSSPA